MSKKQGKKDVPAPAPQAPGLHPGERFQRLREEMDRFAQDMFAGRLPTLFGGGGADMPLNLGGAFGAVAPRIDVHETDKALTITAELPGIDEKDVNLSIRNGVLTLKGEKRYEKTGDEEEARIVERSYGAFQRSFTLPDSVDDSKADASFDKGVLTITLPKRPGAETPDRKIAIRKV